MRMPALRHLAATATALAFATILLGVYTATTGAGLACDARWPLCDGWLGLFPDGWHSFVEWFHRLVAMFTGFAVLGTAVAAWRGGASRRIRRAATFALALTPVQFVLGAMTVFSYRPTEQVAHHAAALLIFAALLATALWAFEEANGPRTEEPSRTDTATADD